MNKLMMFIGLLTFLYLSGDEYTLNEIRVRDPFILADDQTQTYYLYAQMGNRTNSNPDEVGVEVYTSSDLKNWQGPEPVFQVPDNFWGRNMVWAPEVHAYKGKYYLFVTFTSEDTLTTAGKSNAKQWKRGTQILESESPAGPFKVISDGSQTPPNWMSLDGSLWVEDGTPYMVFCHEWAQTEVGTIEVVELSEDLSKAVGQPKTLFTAKAWDQTKSMKSIELKYHGYVTDGNFVYQTKEGKLVMIWSTFGRNGYALLQAVSENGSIHGPWRQIQEPIFAEDSGHGMIFRSFDGRLMLTFHQPNGGGLERAQLYEIEDKGDYIELAQP